MNHRLQLQTMKKDDLIVDDYIPRIKSIDNHLTTIGESIFECDHILYVLGVLDSNYNSFVSSITMRYGDVSFNEFHSLLLIYECQ